MSSARRSNQGRRMASTSSMGAQAIAAARSRPILRACISAASASGSRPQRHDIEGTLQLPNEGYRSRTTDFLNAHERDFLALIDAEVTWLDAAREPERHEYLAVAARHIVLVLELETLGVFDEPNPALGLGAAVLVPVADASSASATAASTNAASRTLAFFLCRPRRLPRIGW